MVREVLLLITHNDFALPPWLLAVTCAAALFFLTVPLARRADDLFPINIPSWSLFFEMLVNILYAAMSRHLGVTVLIMTYCISAILFMLAAQFGSVEVMIVKSVTFHEGLIRTVLSFSLGLLIHRVGPTPILAVPTWLLLILVAAALMFPWGGQAYDVAFVLVISPLIVLLGTAAEPSGAIARISIWLSVISFPLYAIHRPMLYIAQALSERLPVSKVVFGWLAIVAVVLLAYAADRFDRAARRI